MSKPFNVRRWVKSKSFLVSLVVLFAVLVVVFIASFLIVFWNYDFSEDLAAWGQFGDYFGMIVNLAGTVAVFFLSYLVFKGQRERDSWEKKILEINDMPILVFTADNNVYNKCINVGKGSAHKVVIGKVAFNGKQTLIKAYSIPPNCYLGIQWENDPDELYAYYESVAGRKYVVRCKDDLNVMLVDGEFTLKNHPEQETAEWLNDGAQRHSGVSLRMLNG